MTAAAVGGARDRRATALAVCTRNGIDESVHVGHAVVVAPNGAVLRAWGDPERVILPRSSNKPAQASAMVGVGLDLPDNLLAIAASSHSGEPVHIDAVRALLQHAGLEEGALQTPADFPLGRQARDAWVASGRGPEPIAMNCSGKHAAMLATCVRQDWPLDSYRDADHPLQRAIAEGVADLAGESIPAVGVDGCGAPVLGLSIAGLARSVSRVAHADPASPPGRVGAAMQRYPELVGGTERDVTAFMRAVPGLVAKDGAEGVYAAALPDGRAVAIKVDDGSDRGRQVALARILLLLGVDGADGADGAGADRGALEALAHIPVLGGGRPVGMVWSPLE